MNIRQMLGQESTVRVDQLLLRHPRLREDPVIAELMERLHRRVLRIEALAAEQATATNQITFRSKTLELRKQELRELMLAPGRFGRRTFRDDLALRAACAVPHKRSTAEEITDAADRLADTIRSHRDDFRGAKFPAGLAGDLRRAAKALRRLARGVSVKQDRSRVTLDIKHEMSEARHLVAMLEPQVLAFGRTIGDRGIPSAWRRAARLGKKLGRPKRRKSRGSGDADAPAGS